MTDKTPEQAQKKKTIADQIVARVKAMGAQSNKFEEALEDTFNSVVKAAEKSKPIHDGYSNSVLAIGHDDKIEQFNTFSLDNNTLNWTLWLALYNDSWVFRRAIDKPAQDEVRCGITLQSKADTMRATQILKQHRSDFIDLLKWGALFGGSVACIMLDNCKDEDYAKAMSLEKLRKAKKMTMYVVDRWYGIQPSTKTVSNMQDIDYGKPASYIVTLADGHQVKFHHSWVLRYEHRTAPKLIKNGMLQGWGYAEGAHIINEITADEKLRASVQSLINKALIEVIKMDGMRGVFMGADDENAEQLEKRLEMVNWARDFNSLTFLDSNDDYQMNSFSGLSGLSDLLEKNMWRISAALEMQGVLFGDLKGGFANDTTALERYDETINGRCESFLRPVYEKFLRIVYRMLGINDKVEFTFNSLLTREQTEKQVDDISKFVDLCSKLLADGVLTPRQYAKAVQNYTQNGTIDFGLDDEAIDKLDDDVVNEDFDLGNEPVDGATTLGNDGEAV